MEQILQIREIIISYFKRYETIIIFVLKFLIGVILFSLIGGIGQSMPVFDKVTAPSVSLLFMLLLSFIFAVAPMPIGYMFIILDLGIQTSAVMEAAVILVVFLLCVLIFYARLAPKESVLILATVAAYYFKLPYLVPIVAGMYFSMTSVIPISIGVFIWQHIPFMLAIFETGKNAEYSISEMPDIYKDLYAQLVNTLTSNTDWVVISFIFAMVVLLVYVVSRLSIDYSKDIAIVLGGVTTLVSLIIAVLVANVKINLLGVLLSVIVSVAIAECIRFFDVVMDYQRAERVQFQDEDNVYYVRIVPKVIMQKRNRVVRAIGREPEQSFVDTNSR